MADHSAVISAKLALERELMGPIFLVARQYIKAWTDNGGALDPTARFDHQRRTEAVLRRHYARTVMVMLGKKPPISPTLEQAALSLRHLEGLRARAKNQALMLLAGIDRDLQEARAADKSATDMETKDKVRGVTVGYAMRITGWAKRAVSKLKGRLGAITNIQTQGPAEEARFEYVPDDGADGRVLHTWSCQLDGRVRHPPKSNFDHFEPHGQTVPVREPFEVSGESLRFPGDLSLGASLGNVVNCFPAGTQVSGCVRGAMRHWYEGDLVEITTRRGHRLSGTPNHPVLTAEGWVALGQLHKGSYVFSSGHVRYAENGSRCAAGFHGRNTQHIHDVEPAIEQVFDALAKTRNVVRVANTAVNFYGHQPAQDVDVVRTEGSLWFGCEAELLEQLHKAKLASSYFLQRSFPAGGAPELFAHARRLPTPSDVRRFDQGLEFIARTALEADQVGLTSVARGYAGVFKALCDHGSLDAHSLGHGENRLASIVSLKNLRDQACSAILAATEIVAAKRAHGDARLHELAVDPHGTSLAQNSDLMDGLSSFVELDEVVDFSRRNVRCHVYDLDTVHGMFLAQGVVSRNCRCTATYILRRPDGSEVEITATPAAVARRQRAPSDRPSAGVDNRPAYNPTSVVTLNGKTRARVILGSGEVATLRQESSGLLTVRMNGDTVARARFSGGTVTEISVSPRHLGKDIEGLISRSVQHSANR